MSFDFDSYTDHTLGILDLSEAEYGDQDLAGLISYIRAHPALQTLNFNVIGEDMNPRLRASILNQLPEFRNITSLHLRYWGLVDSDVIRLANFSHITYLDVSMNINIFDLGARALIANTSINELDVCCCSITSGALTELKSSYEQRGAILKFPEIGHQHEVRSAEAIPIPTEVTVQQASPSVVIVPARGEMEIRILQKMVVCLGMLVADNVGISLPLIALAVGTYYYGDEALCYGRSTLTRFQFFSEQEPVLAEVSASVIAQASIVS